MIQSTNFLSKLLLDQEAYNDVKLEPEAIIKTEHEPQVVISDAPPDDQRRKNIQQNFPSKISRSKRKQDEHYPE